MQRDQITAALEHGVDVAGRRVFLHGSVDEESIGRAIRGMYLLADEDTGKPIELYVTSYGGELDEAFALHDVTRTISCPVHTVALGKCMSAAPLLVACGKPGERWASEHCQFMLHDATLDAVEGPPSYVAGQAEVARQQMRTIAQLLGRYTKMGAAHWARMFTGKADRFFGVIQAQRWGLIDNIWSEKD
jgi:ATP-dependent Clp endopeptidase proteolytic subunit ClpP